jgi:hypothetical protein
MRTQDNQLIEEETELKVSNGGGKGQSGLNHGANET